MTLPAPPAVPAFATGFGYHDTDMDALVQAPLAFLADQVVFRAHFTNVTTIGTSFSPVLYNVIDEDPYGGWDPVNFWWEAPFTGWYSVTTTCSIATSAVSLRAAIRQTGSAIFEGTGALLSGLVLGEGSAAATLQLARATDYIEGGALVSALANTDNYSAGRYPSLEITYWSQ
jgi:hypothetical protein